MARGLSGIAGSLLVVILLLAGCSSGTSTSEKTNENTPNQTDSTKVELPDKVVVGYQTIPNPVFYAKDQKWFEEEMGVPVEFKEFKAGADINAALLSGSIDFGWIGSTATSIGIGQGIDYTAFMVANLDTSEVIVSRDSAEIKGLKDFVGKKVATPFGSTSHFRLMQSLQAEGIDEKSIEILNMSPPNIAAAWERKDIDGASVWNPVVSKLLTNDGSVLLDTNQMQEMGIQTVDVFVATKNFVEKYPQLISSFAKVADRSFGFYFENEGNQKSVIASVSKWVGMEESQVEEVMKDMKYIPIKDQLTEAYFGTTDKPGKLPVVLKDTSEFLEKQQLSSSTPPMETFNKLVTPKYMANER